MKFVSGSHLQQENNQTLYALLGAVTVLAGLVLAIACMPDDPQPVGAMFAPALCLALGLLAVPILRARRSVSSVLRAEHILMLALVYWLLLDPLQSAYPLYLVSYDSVLMAMTAIATMAIGIWVGTAGKGWQPPSLILRTARFSIDDASLFWGACIAFLLGTFYFALSSGFDLSIMLDGLGRERFAAPWDRGDKGDWRAFAEHMVYFGYVLPSLTVLLAHRKGWLQPRVIISATFSLIMVLFLAQSSGRRIIGVVIGAALVSWLLMQKRLRLKLVIGAAIALALLLMAMQGMVIYRKTGFEGWLRGETPREQFSHLHVDDNFLRLSQTTALFPDVSPYVGLQPIAYLLTRPIPRVFWPDKPIDPGYNLTSLVYIPGSTLSLSHSIVGELYVMSGLWVVFLGGLLLGRVAGMWNKLLELRWGREKIVIWGLGIMILFASIRSMQDLLIMSYSLVGWLIVARIVQRREAKRGIPAGSDTTMLSHRADSQ
jgi:hypothetical protein